MRYEQARTHAARPSESAQMISDKLWCQVSNQAAQSAGAELGGHGLSC
jgi:hypothetical protein